MGNAARPAWHGWNLKQWNDALVEIVFDKRPNASSEILRIDATHRLLVAGANDDSANSDAIRQSFINAFPKSLTGLKRLFDPWTVTQIWEPSDIDLPFFAQLYLTILVASADEDTFEIGNFRSRFEAMLGIHRSAGHVFNGLPELWKHAARWTRNTKRPNVRRLVLPDPQREVIIGHSKRLAFPGFSDQTKLANLLSDHGLDARSPESKIIKAIGQRRHLFSTRFGEEFDNFLRLIKRGDRLNAVRSPFWGAIVEITWDPQTLKNRRRESEFELELDANDPYTATLLLLAQDQSPLKNSWEYRELPFPVGDVKYEVVHIRDSGTTLIDLLHDKSGQALVSGTNLAKWLSRGWIGFARDESERWIASADLSNANALWLLVKEDRWTKVGRALHSADRRPDYELKGVLSEHWVLSGPFRNNAGLRQILQDALDDRDSFAVRLSPSQIRLIDAIRLPEGILIVWPCFPVVVATDASGVSWKFASESDDSLRSLVQDSDKSELFTFDREQLSSLPPTGEIELRAYDTDGEEIDRTHFFFVNGCISHEFKELKDLSSFLREGDTGQLVSLTTAGAATDLPDAVPRLNGFFAVRKERHVNATVQAIDVDDISDQWSSCFEILTGNFVRRVSIPIQELLQITAQIWGADHGKRWDRLNDLIENGFVEQLHHRRWRGSVFVGKPPQAVALDGSISKKFRIIGLMPESRLRKLQALTSIRGGTCRIIASVDLKQVGAVEVELGRDVDATSIFSECGIRVSALDRNFKFKSWDTILATEADVPPRTKSEVWDAEKRFFSFENEIRDGEAVLERWPSDRMQTLYRLTFGDSRWSTRSRLWALLAYGVASDRFIGSFGSDGSLHLKKGLYLPPSFSKLVLCYGAGVCVSGTNNNRIYPAATTWNMRGALASWCAAAAPTSFQTALSRYHAALAQRARSKGRSRMSTMQW